MTKMFAITAEVKRNLTRLTISSVMRGGTEAEAKQKFEQRIANDHYVVAQYHNVVHIH